MSNKKIILTGGGTVGHVTLNLLLIPQFINDGWEVHYIGDKHGIEHKEINRLNLGVRFHAIATGKLRRYFSFQNLLDIFKVGFGTIQSAIILAKVKPNALFSKGGFVSVPPVIAAKYLRVPVFVHESDLSMGLANKIAYKFSNKMFSTFEQNPSLTKIEHIGAITKIHPDEPKENDTIRQIKSYFDNSKKTLLFVGGSAGAKVFNNFVTANLTTLTKTYNIINISGDSTLNTLEKNLYRVDYVTDLYQPLMDLADVVITRGGSNTIFELVALQKLHLIVPLGREASRGDQIENADYFERKGYALQLSENDLTIEQLNEKVNSLLASSDRFESAMRNSTELTSQKAFYHHLVQEINNSKRN